MTIGYNIIKYFSKNFLYVYQKRKLLKKYKLEKNFNNKISGKLLGKTHHCFLFSLFIESRSGEANTAKDYLLFFKMKIVKLLKSNTSKIIKDRMIRNMRAVLLCTVQRLYHCK